MPATLIKITKKRALAYIDRAVQKKGKNYVDRGAMHSSCEYFHEKRSGGFKPSCIVGHVFWYAGIRDEERINKILNNACEIQYLLHDTYLDGVTITPAALRVLEAAQTSQDDQNAWGIAQKRAREAARSK